MKDDIGLNSLPDEILLKILQDISQETALSLTITSKHLR